MSFFDTASIYGQGDSERILGRVLGNRRDCIVCSKVGQRLPVPNPALMPVKRLARILAGRSHTIRRAVSNARAQPMPRNWCPQYLADAVDGSLRRLGRDQVDIMLLHGPPVEVLVEGEAIDALEAARRVGKVGIIGVSADDAASAQAAAAEATSAPRQRRRILPRTLPRPAPPARRRARGRRPRRAPQPRRRPQRHRGRWCRSSPPPPRSAARTSPAPGRSRSDSAAAPPPGARSSAGHSR